MIEREIKLRFRSPEEARVAVLAAGATPLRGRRLQDDYLLDTADDMLRGRGSALRVRLESGKSLLTFKGPVQPASTKLREELETIVDDGLRLLRILDDVIVAVDETPFGTFVEIEGGESGIARVAGALSRGPDDYLLDSYRGLFSEHCRQRGLPFTDMLFGDDV